MFSRSRSTGKERDAESGNDYFGARYYASSVGRFMSPDWSAKVEPVPYSKLDDPQSLNLYAYVGNNPLSRVDPDGHQDNSCKANPGLCKAILDSVTSGGSIQDGYQSWKDQKKIKDKPPTPPTDKEKKSGNLANGGFIFYGNFGGPGWTGGQTAPLEDLSPSDQKKLAAPVDAQDACYQTHDMCYSNGRILNGGTSDLVASQSPEQKRAQKTWERGCDGNVNRCLGSLNSSDRNGHSRAASALFKIFEVGAP